MAIGSVLLMTLRLCVLLWASEGQEDTLTDYENRVLALVPRHGGDVVSRVRRIGDGAGPLEVQIIHLPDDSALRAYMEDPERLALADVHRHAVARTELLNVETIV
jgi:uncharacterized protein (DUF1330 family)